MTNQVDRHGSDPQFDDTGSEPSEHLRLLLTVPAVARALSVSKTTVYELFSEGELPIVRIGRSSRVRITDLEDYVGRLTG